MNHLRFSLAGLMGAVVVIALALAAMLSTSELWSTAVFTAMTFTLFVALLGIIYRREDARAFWVGFAVLGWGHMLLAYGPGLQKHLPQNLLPGALVDYLYPKLQRAQSQPTSSPVASPQGGTAQARGANMVAGMSGMDSGPQGGTAQARGANMVAGMSGMDSGPQGATAQARGANMAAGMSGMGSGPVSGPVPARIGPSPGSLSRTCNSLWTLVVASAGGLLGRYFYLSRSSKTAVSTDHSELRGPT